MQPFDFVFSLFGLLLGFTLIQVLTGFVRSVRATLPDPLGGTEPVRIGLLTPLLGLFVLLDITSYWSNIWNARELIPMGLDVMFGILFLVGVYYFAASFIFPDQPRQWPDFDLWFWLHRRLVLGGLLVVNLLWVVVSKIDAPPNRALGLMLAIQAAYFVPLTVAVAARKPRVVGGSLALLIVLYFGLAAEALLKRF